jgi:hypothetical protein
MSHTLALLCGVVWVSLQFAATFLFARAAFSLARSSKPEITAVLKLAFAAMWFAPLGILMVRQSWWLLLGTGCLAIALANLRTGQAEDSNHFFDASALQTGAVAAIAGAVGIAALCIGIACYRITRSVSPEPSRSRRQAAILIAIVLTAVGLIPSSTAPRTGQALEEGDATMKSKQPNQPDLFSGVILKTTKQSHVALVAPPSRRTSYGRGMLKPMFIPFSGEYWMFYWPRRRPPKSSLLEFGDPNDFKFTAADFSRLSMEARQTISAPIDVESCGSIEVDITSTDPMPGTVFLELILADTRTTQAPRQSLGEVEARATGKLHFEVPSQSAIQEFDEIAVVYRLQPPRVHRSANISINSFLLIPR